MAADFVQRGRQLVEHAQFQEAVKVCRLGLLAHPTQLEGRLVLGAALMALRRYDEVLAEMRIALEIDLAHPRALALKGEALLRKGDPTQAAAILSQAGAADPADPVIRMLYDEARDAIDRSASGHRRSAPIVEERTDHYPVHRIAPTEPAIMGEVPPPEVLAVGDRSGTIELDPADEAIVMDEIDPLAAPPLSVANADQPTVIGEKDESTSDSIELSRADMLPYASDGDSLQGVPVQAPVYPVQAPVYPVPMHAAPDYRTREGTEEPSPFDDPDDDDEDAGEELTSAFDEPDVPVPSWVGQPPPSPFRTPSPAVRPGPGMARATTSIGGRDFDDMFPEANDDGVEGEGWQPPPSALRGGSPRFEPPGMGAPTWQPPGAPLPTRQSGSSPSGGYATLLGQGPPSSGITRSGVTRSRTEDMATIRAGLGLDSDPARQVPPPSVQPVRERVPPTIPPDDGPRHLVSRSQPAANKKPKKKGGLPLIVYAVMALAVVGGAVFAGFKVRDARLEGQIASARDNAAVLLRRDTFAAYSQVRHTYERIAMAKDTPKYRAALARIDAAIAVEFGTASEHLADEIDALSNTDTVDAHIARTYWAIVEQDATAAQKAASVLAARYPQEELAHYMIGRAALAADDPKLAEEEFRKAIAAQKRPLFYLGLARADARLGRVEDGLAALSLATEEPDGVPGHPEVTILEARLLAETERLPPRVGDPEAGLEAILTEGRKPIEEQDLGVSPGQMGWAALVLAEVKLARGDRALAKDALEQARKASSDDPAFSEALSDALIMFGDTTAAREVALEAAKRWPKRTAAHVALARVALAEDRAQDALDALAKAGDLSSSPTALTARGRAWLAAGKLDDAQADLDAALAVAPNLRDAVVARAQLDLQRDDAGSAIKKLEPLYSAGAESEVSIVYAAALRRTGRIEVARAVIQKLLSGPAAPRAYLELARTEREAGELDAAREAYAKAVEMAPAAVEPRLEAATLRMDSGDAIGARDQLSKLADVDAPQNGPVLVEAARVHTMTGDAVKAGALLERASQLSSAPGWELARERGRQLIASGKNADAITELTRAKSLKPNDPDTRLLLIEAHARSNNAAGVGAEIEDIAKDFRGSALQRLARGRAAAMSERWPDAIDHYVQAVSLLERERARPRERAEALVLLGRAYQRKGELEDSAKELRQAIEVDPSNAEAVFALGEVVFEQEEPKQALALYEKSLELNPHNATGWFFVGETYSQRKGSTDKAKATAALKKYLELAPTGDYAQEANSLLAQMR